MAGAPAYDHDVVVLSDLRYPGGNSSSVAEEIKAQARAGYTTGLVHLKAPHMVHPRAFNRKIAHCLSAGLAELVEPDRPVRTRLLVIRQPRLFTDAPAARPRIEADTVILVANQPPVDGLRSAEAPYYDPAVVRDRVEELFGEVSWAPVGPLVREVLAAGGVPLPLRPDDWSNILDMDEWWVDRSRPPGRRPVIGRHSRGHQSKWPTDAGDILAAYPEDPAFDVRILGGAEPVIGVLGAVPAAWTVHPFGAMPPNRFLGEIDFFVYYHHPGWVEAFGRNIIEAMASGCPAILPPHFRALFGDACDYRPPAGVRELVTQLHADPAAYAARVERSRALVEERFSAAMHARRLEALIGPPSGRPAAVPRRAQGTVLCASTALHGAGSATRLLRAAARLPAGCASVLLAPSPALELAVDAGVVRELLPDAVTEHDPVAAGRRIADAARRHDAGAVLLDAPAPDPELLAAAAAGPAPVIRLAEHPHAADARLAATVELPRATLERIVALPAAAPAAAGRAEARAAIGLPGDAPLALLAPGGDERTVAVARLRATARALLDAGWAVVLPEALVGVDDLRLPDGVLRPRLRPLAAHLAAFDLAVAAPGRTLVAELAAARVPALFVALRAGQRGTADGSGGVLGLADPDEARLGRRLAELRDPDRRRALAAGWDEVALHDAGPAVLAALAAAGAVRAEAT